MTLLVCCVIVALGGAVLSLGASSILEEELRAQVRGRDGRIRQLESELAEMAARHARELQRLKPYADRYVQFLDVVRAAVLKTGPLRPDLTIAFDPHERRN